jgi:hypothetical protein
MAQKIALPFLICIHVSTGFCEGGDHIPGLKIFLAH